MAKNTPSVELFLNDCRLSFPHLWKPHQFDERAEPQYSVTLLFKDGDANHRALSAGIKRLIADMWPNGKPPGLKHCLRNGVEKEGMDGYGAGVMFISANNDNRFTVIDQLRRPLVEADGKPYAGCYVNAKVRLWAQDNKWGKRVNAQCLGVQFFRDGDSFGGGARVASPEDFEIYSSTGEAVEDDDPLLG